MSVLFSITFFFFLFFATSVVVVLLSLFVVGGVVGVDVVIVVVVELLFFDVVLALGCWFCHNLSFSRCLSSVLVSFALVVCCRC